MSKSKRKAGILLPLTALPSPYGIGCLSGEAYEFVDFLAACGQSEWQILPLSPTSVGDSPYQSPSAFAGNPYLIDLEALITEGLLSREECDATLGGCAEDRVDYGLQYEARMPLLFRAYERWKERDGTEDLSFSEKNAYWLEDYALFMALKDHFGGVPWQDWPKEIRRREPNALDRYRRELADQIGFGRFLQHRIFTEWQSLRQYAGERGIRIIGDLPIYVSSDSADVWAHPELFFLNEEGRPLRVAGCPPDDFTPNGQLWGNPLYRWDEHRRSDYGWWLARLNHAFSLFDVVRIDHFRGFDSYYSIPATAETAKEGKWERGIGDELFRVAEEVIGKGELIAEDLGYVTDSVRALLEKCGFPGMKILQFGFGGEKGDFSSEDLPHYYPEHCVAYTGTHDNATLRGWLASCDKTEREKAEEYLWLSRPSDKELAEGLIAALMRSPAERCLVPLQDYLGLGDEARMNIPARGVGNWQWRVKKEQLNEELREKILRLCKIGGRNTRSSD